MEIHLNCGGGCDNKRRNRNTATANEMRRCDVEVCVTENHHRAPNHQNLIIFEFELRHSRRCHVDELFASTETPRCRAIDLYGARDAQSQRLGFCSICAAVTSTSDVTHVEVGVTDTLRCAPKSSNSIILNLKCGNCAAATSRAM